MKLFLLEDDYLLNKSISLYFKAKGWEVASFDNGLCALHAIHGDYDVMILDIDVPDLGGIDLLGEIRKLYSSRAIIMISATIDIEMISKAYTAGCSDYMKKPFDIRELELKIQTFVRQISEILTLGTNLTYHKREKRLLLGSDEIILTPKEQSLLHLLIENRGKIVPPDHILSAVWGYDVGSAHLRQLLSRLRKKLPENIIQNRTGSGYCIV